MRRLLACLALTGSLHAQQPSPSQVAGLEQDLALLRSDVARLSEQVADLQIVVQRLRTSQPAAAPASNSAADRQAILAEVDRRNAALRVDLDKALAAFTKQVNDALANRGNTVAVAPVPANPSETTPAAPTNTANTALPADMPRSGIRYKVKAGESLSGIARRNGSKVDWILKANQMDNPNQLKAESEIFIPQP